MRNLLTCLAAVTLFIFFNSCKKELSVEYGEPAQGSLQSSAGDCLPKLVGGSFISGKALNDSNFIEVTVNVLSPGPYTIYTDSINGYSFKATGSFPNTGANTVRLKGNGQPLTPGVNNFTVQFDSSFCDIAVTVLPSGASGGPAAFTLDGAPGGCTAFALNGNFFKDTTLDTRHNVKVNVTVTTVGTYSITTNTVNGYFFSASGTFGATGPAQVTLQGIGKPLAAGTDNFTVTAGASNCTFPVTVTAAAPPPGSCTVSALQGTYTVGTATTASNTVTVTHTYATAASYTVSTNTVNGYSFGPSNITATAGSNSITLNAVGTPAAAGTNTFTVTFGDGQTCTFTVTANAASAPNTDYFPTTLNSWWSYDDGAGSDSFKMTNNGPVTIASTVFQRFIFNDDVGPFDTAFYRKDAATGFYYESIDTAGFGPEVVFTVPRLNVLFLKNTLTTGASWNSDFAATVQGVPLPATVRFKYTCVNANASITVNGKNFTNVYQVDLMPQVGVGTTFQDILTTPVTSWYAKGIGLIKVDDGTNIQAIRSWVVN